MHGPIRRLVNPPVSSREAFAELDRQASESSEAQRLIAEHTGRDEYLLADKIADALASGARAVALTSGERLVIANVIAEHRKG